MSNGSILTENKNTLLVIALFALVGGGGGSVAVKSIMPERADPFTGAEGRALEVRLKQEMNELEKRLANRIEVSLRASTASSERELQLNLREFKGGILSNLPPPATKQRIQAIEAYLQETGNFKPPTYQWQ